MRKVHSDDDPWVHVQLALCWKDEPEDRTFVGDLAFPSWVPMSVIQMAASMWKIDAERRPRSCVDDNTEAQEAILRLARDSRMREVWNELRKKHHHIDAPVAWSHWHKILGETASLVDRTPEEIGLALFFHRAVLLVLQDFALRDAARPVGVTADQLRLEADFLDFRDGRERPENLFVPIFESNMRFLDTFGLQTNGPVIQRDRGNRRVRLFANLLANVSNQLFGQVLHGTVANTVNVALDLKGEQQVAREHVKNWRLRDWVHKKQK
jgi:hypothetical protein